MNGPFIMFGKYGVQTTFVFTLEDGSTTDCYTGSDIVAADTTISKDGGASAATTNAVTTTNAPFFTIVLTATEMQATRILVRINDASAAAFKDAVLLILTKLPLGQIDVDATQIGGNTAAISATGVGTGYGLNVSGASDTYYTNIFTQELPAEPSAAFASTDAIGTTIGRIVRRFFNKTTVSSTTMSHYKDNASTVRESQAVSDDGSTQTLGASS